MSGLSEFDIVRYEAGRVLSVRDAAVVERRVDIRVNGETYLSVMATPRKLEFLALGLLYGEGVIDDVDEVQAVVADESGLAVDVMVSRAVCSERKRVRISGFGMGMVPENLLQQAGKAPLWKEVSLDPERLMALMEEFNQRSGLFRKTGAVHSCCFCRGDKRIFEEDVGRHNALDKVVGQCLSERLGTTGAVLLTTGRVSTEILLKTAKAGICMLISRSAPTDRAVILARDLDMTLVGFARGDRFNVYSGEERIFVDRLHRM